MSDIKDWSTTAASNNASPPDGFPEGMAPSDVNNSAREVMASVRGFYDNYEWRDWGHTYTYASSTSFTTAAGDGDTTAVYHEQRRIQAVGSLTGTIWGSISSSSHSSVTTVNITWDVGSLQNETLTISVGPENNTVYIPYNAIGDIPTTGNLIAPNNTSMVFFQASATTGWTQSTTHNNKALRVVSGTGGGSGGTHGLSTPPSVSHTHTMGTHNHKWNDYLGTSTGSQSFNVSGIGSGYFGNSTTGDTFDGLLIGSNLDGRRINVDFYTDNVDPGDTTGSGTLTAFSPLYIDVIVCDKD